MKPIYDAWLIQIEITNDCLNKCSHCTRGIRHIKNPIYLDLDHIEKALCSLKDWKKGVGCFGGEPTLHPQFPEICELYKKHFPKHQCGLWTSGGDNFRKYYPLIRDTFGIINYNDHKNPSLHHPLMIASEEIIPDSILRDKLIDNCWLQLHWSPIITAKGGFFCEVAATYDFIFSGPGGYPLELGWWRKDPSQFQDQRDMYCRYCSIPLPFKPFRDDFKYDLVSPGNAERLKQAHSPQSEKNMLLIVDEELTSSEIPSISEIRNNKQSKKYSPLDPPHFWVRTPIKAWFWKKAKYKYIKHGCRAFATDTSKFLASKFFDSLRWLFCRHKIEHPIDQDTL